MPVRMYAFIDICMGMYWHMCGHVLAMVYMMRVCVDMCAGIDVCVGMCLDMCVTGHAVAMTDMVQVCVDMYIAMCVDRSTDMCLAYARTFV